MYLKWLVKHNGERVPVDEAWDAFSEDENVFGYGLTEREQDTKWCESIARRNGWKFVPVAGLPDLASAVELFLAEETMRRKLK